MKAVDAAAALQTIAHSEDVNLEELACDPGVMRLVNCIRGVLLGSEGEDTPQVLASTAWSLAKFLLGDSPLLDSIAAASIPRISEF